MSGHAASRTAAHWEARGAGHDWLTADGCWLIADGRWLTASDMTVNPAATVSRELLANGVS
jgi:hypothetical protein